MTRITRENLGELFPEDGAPEAWAHYRKRTTTPMLPLEGPATVATKEGNYDLPDGWCGQLAIDADGDPYPIEQSVFERTYELVPPDDTTEAAACQY